MSARRTLAGLTITAAAAAGFTPSAVAADDPPPSVRSIAVHDVRISGAGCHDVPITIRFAAHGWRVIGINAGVYYHGEAVGYLLAEPKDADASSARTSAKWCGSSGLGKYVVGPSTITYYNPNGAGTKRVEDATTAAFRVRRDARAKITSQDVTSSGASVDARLRAYSLSAHRYVGLRGVTALLQTKRPGGKWSTVGSEVTGARGAVSLEASGKQLWRVVSRPTGQVAKAVSPTFD